MEKRSWCDSVLCTDTLALFTSELLLRLRELLELEDGKVAALGSRGMSDGFRLITDGPVVAQSEPPGDWKMLAIWATFDEETEGATELRILSNCFSPSLCLKESKSNQAETNKLCRTTVVGLLAENL